MANDYLTRGYFCRIQKGIWQIVLVQQRLSFLTNCARRLPTSLNIKCNYKAYNQFYRGFYAYRCGQLSPGLKFTIRFTISTPACCSVATSQCAWLISLRRRRCSCCCSVQRSVGILQCESTAFPERLRRPGTSGSQVQAFCALGTGNKVDCLAAGSERWA